MKRSERTRPRSQKRRAGSPGAELTVEEQLRRAKRLAMIGRLAVIATHELSNYLSIVLGNATLLQEALASGRPPGRLLDALVMGATRGAGLAGQLRTLARPPSGEMRNVDLAKSVRAVFTMMERITPCVLGLSIGKGTPLNVRADGAWIEQILVNLLLNAVEASRKGGRVFIRAGRVATGVKRGWCYCEVADQGRGISPRIRRKMCELFFTTKPKGKGTGIGLALAAELIEKSGGELIIRSRAGRGATLRVLLPPTDV